MTTQLRSVELFSGAAGLGLGLARAGFHHEVVVENNHMACETIRLNQRNGHELVQGWEIREASIENVDLSDIKKHPDLLAAGPPCQDFSVGGKHAGSHGTRNLWPWTIDAVRELEPLSFAFENVPAMATSHKAYLDYLTLALALPSEARPHGDWVSDKERLQAIIADRDPPKYRVKVMLLNAADYGTAQARKRIFVIGTRADLAEIETPTTTHSYDQLMADKWKNGSYWERVGIARPEMDQAGERWMRKDNQRPMPDMFDLLTAPPAMAAHRTVREAMQAIPASANCNEPAPRKAKAYKGHTGSPIDEPSKTLRAGDHGVSGGENMTDFGPNCPDISKRYEHFSVRQAAAVSDFPMDYDFAGTWSDGLKQIGNAVPGNLGYVVGNEIRRALAA